MKAWLYRLLKNIFFLSPPEEVHHSIVAIGELLGRFWVGRFLVSIFFGYRGPDISRIVDGIKYRTPIMLSAGFDYNGRLTQILPSISFGGEEIGSVTLWPSEGNPHPQLTRLKKSKSILVYKGLKNDGVKAISARLRNSYKYFVHGISIARTNSDSTVGVENGIDDFFGSLEYLVTNGIGDYYTINISCPNSFGGEDFAKPELLDRLLSRLKIIKHERPMYVKLPINISWSDFDELLKIVLKNEYQGVVIGNLNKNYNDLTCQAERPVEIRGGLSGYPCRKLSNDLIKKTKDKYGDKLTIIGVGGVLTVKDALEKFDLGADLVQLITGLIFTGPQLPQYICRRLAKRK